MENQSLQIFIQKKMCGLEQFKLTFISIQVWLEKATKLVVQTKVRIEHFQIWLFRASSKLEVPTDSNTTKNSTGFPLTNCDYLLRRGLKFKPNCLSQTRVIF